MRTPVRAHRRAASRPYAPRPRAPPRPDASRGAGAAAVGEAGRGQLAEVGQQPGRRRAVRQLEHVPGACSRRCLRRARPAASVTPSGQRRSDRAGRRASAGPARPPCAPRGPSDSGRCRRCGPATSALGLDAASAPSTRAKSSAAPLGAVLRLGVPHDAQPVVAGAPRAAWSTSPAYSSCGGPGGGPDGVPGVAETWTVAPGRAQTASARRSRARSPVRSPRAGQTEKSVRAEYCHAVGGDPRQLGRDPGRLGRGVARVRRRGGAVRAPAVAGQPEQRAAHRERRPPRRAPPSRAAGAASDRWAAPAANRGRTRGSRAAPYSRRPRPSASSSAACRVRPPRRRPAPRARRRRQLLQTAQDIGGPGRAGQRRQPLVQGEFVGAARAREEPQAPHLRQQRRQLRALRPRPSAAAAARPPAP